MQSTADLLHQLKIEDMALPSSLRYGQAIYRRGAVEIIEQTPEYTEGWAGGLDGTMAEGGGQRRRVRFSSSPEGLVWHCAGNPKKSSNLLQTLRCFSPGNQKQLKLTFPIEMLMLAYLEHTF